MKDVQAAAKISLQIVFADQLVIIGFVIDGCESFLF